MEKVNIIAEIGINHNGTLSDCLKLIDIASFAGCDYVKFQKRTPSICVPDSQKEIMKETPWGTMTYLEYKERIELNELHYIEIERYCKEKGIKWFASVWDEPSAHFMSEFCNTGKIPSAKLTDDALIETARDLFDILLLSTGMSFEDEIEHAVRLCNPDVIMHTNSAYPSQIEELNLSYINWLKHMFSKPIGYSGHEFGLIPTFAAVAMGATWIERHITLDRTMWGSDQMASVEPHGLIKLVKGIRDIEKAMGTYGPRQVLGSELSKLKSLRTG